MTSYLLWPDDFDVCDNDVDVIFKCVIFVNACHLEMHNNLNNYYNV